MPAGGFEPPVPHEPACHFCGHPVHHLTCDARGCSCNEGAIALGIDTALGG